MQLPRTPSSVLKAITNNDLTALSGQAQVSARRRANANLHAELSDPIQRLAIAMEPDTLIPPHRHPQTWEVLTSLRGRFTVLMCDDTGTVIERAVMGEGASVVEIPAGGWRAVLSHDTGGVIFEVKHGPYGPIGHEDVATCSMGRSADARRSWCTVAQLGQRIA